MAQVSSQSPVDAEFLCISRHEMEQRFSRIEQCVSKLTTEQIWSRGSEVENSIGNLILHLVGNVRQWILAGVGGASDTRNRDKEFSQRTPILSSELVELLRETIAATDLVLSSLTEKELLKTRRIQDHDVTVLHAITHVVTHFAEHTGQIIYLTKNITAEDLHLNRYLTWRDASISIKLTNVV